MAKKVKKSAKKKTKPIKKKAQVKAKKAAKITVKKKTAEVTVKQSVEENYGKEVGRITHFFDHILVAVLELNDELKKGDKIRIKGFTTDFVQVVESMQIEHEQVEVAKPGDSIGMKVKDVVRPNDKVYLVD